MSKITFTNNTAQIIDMLKSQAIGFLYEAGGELTTQVSRSVAVDSGELKNSFKSIVDEDELKVIVGSPLENAIWEEFGTGEYALNGDGRKDAWYVYVDSYVGKSKPTYKGKVTIVYGEDGKAFYKTDGKKPKRYFTTSYEKAKPKIERRFKSIMEGK